MYLEVGRSAQPGRTEPAITASHAVSTLAYAPAPCRSPYRSHRCRTASTTFRASWSTCETGQISATSSMQFFIFRLRPRYFSKSAHEGTLVARLQEHRPGEAKRHQYGRFSKC